MNMDESYVMELIWLQKLSYAIAFLVSLLRHCELRSGQLWGWLALLSNFCGGRCRVWRPGGFQSKPM